MLYMITLQACNCKEDSLFSFDLNSDGDGYVYVLLTFALSTFLIEGMYSDICDYIKLVNFLNLLSVSTCKYRIQCICVSAS